MPCITKKKSIQIIRTLQTKLNQPNTSLISMKARNEGYPLGNRLERIVLQCEAADVNGQILHKVAVLLST